MTDLRPTHSAEILRPDFGGAHSELADIELIHGISVALIGEQESAPLYGKIVDAAVQITGSQFGTMQRLCPQDDPSGHGGELQLLCSRGLPEAAVEFWSWVSPSAHSSCTAALKAGRRAIIPDFEAWDEIAGTEDLLAFRNTGIRSAQTTPLISRGGELLGMISTHWSEPHEPTERDLRLLDILARQAADLLERTIAEEAQREAGQRSRLLAAIVEFSHDAIITKSLDGVITSWNAAAERVFGYASNEVIGKPVTILIPEDRQDEEPSILKRLRRGEVIEHFETVRQRKDGELIDVSLTISPVRNEHGVVIGASKIARDITDRVRAEQLLTTLAREAEHRTKNVLMTVLATVQLSSGATTDELKEAIGGRLQALADVNALFVQSRWTGADVRKILAQELAPYGEEGVRISLNGPEILLEPVAAQTLAVTFHELATNAAKYGALGADEGRVSVEWGLDAEGRLDVRWCESGGPPVRAPTRRGFGTRVMQGMVAARGGTLDFKWDPTGLDCQVVMAI